MSEKHAVRRSVFGVFVETGPNEGMSFFGVAVGGQSRRVSMDDSLDCN